MKKLLPLCCFLLIAVSFSSAQEKERYFYRSLPYGSELMYNPFYLILNGSFDVIQLEGNSRNIRSYPYALAAREVGKNLRDPISPIQHFGVKNFIEQEVLPFNPSRKKAQGWPNLNLHLLGGGMTYVRTAEWYEDAGAPFPKTFSVITMGVYHYLNEVVESGHNIGDNVDPISDVYIFDLGGIILFSFDNVKIFFSETLHFADWSLQPMFSLRDGTLRNNGQYFSMKWNWFGSKRWSAFYFFGIDGILGASYLLDDNEHAISFGGGLRGAKRYFTDEKHNRMTVDLVWKFGFFYDRNNSLLASLFLSGLYTDMVTLNIYPWLFDFAGIKPGFALNIDNKFRPTFGITVQYLPGIAYSIK